MIEARSSREDRVLLTKKQRFFEKLAALDDDDGDEQLDQGRQTSQAICRTKRTSHRSSQRYGSGQADDCTHPKAKPSASHGDDLKLRPANNPLNWLRKDTATQIRPSKAVSSDRSKHSTGLAQTVTPISQTTKDKHSETAQILASPALTKSDSAPPDGSARSPSPVHTLDAPSKLQHKMSYPSISSKQPKASLATAASFPRASGKRKRDAKIQYKPEEQQIFQDLVFYFFPNNDTHAGRRIRITKSLEYGATWVKEWCSEVTHVVVDKSFRYDQITSWLKIASFPGKAVVVNETYPADCIMHRFLIDPKQSHYQVPGYAQRTGDQMTTGSTASTAPSPQSLQLKSSKNNSTTRISQTPSRADDSSYEAHQGKKEGALVRKERPSNLEKVPDAKYDDALDEVISETKELQHLPLDLEEDIPSQDEKSGDETDSEHSTLENIVKKAKLGGNFQCMEQHDGKGISTNPNERTIEVLSQMGKYYEQTKDEWRSRAYRRAIASLRKQSKKIATKDEAARLPFVGERLAAKIEEIVWTNRLRRLDNALDEPSDEALRRFLQIYGVGLSQASRWVQQGHKTLDDLRKHVKLTTNQVIGIEHYDDFLARIPRAEVAQHGSIVRDALHKINPAFQVTIGGSYRRGANDSGDIDLIITAPSADAHYLRTTVLDTLVPQLMDSGFLTASLATTRHNEGSKWHGSCVLPGSSPATWRRIDLLLVPWEEMGAALIYFTGNDIFNRSIRLLASKKGMRLNQRGLYKDVMRGRNSERLTLGTLLEARSERRIFEILGVPWRSPEHRIC